MSDEIQRIREQFLTGLGQSGVEPWMVSCREADGAAVIVQWKKVAPGQSEKAVPVTIQFETASDAATAAIMSMDPPDLCIMRTGIDKPKGW